MQPPRPRKSPTVPSTLSIERLLPALLPPAPCMPPHQPAAPHLCLAAHHRRRGVQELCICIHGINAAQVCLRIHCRNLRQQLGGFGYLQDACREGGRSRKSEGSRQKAGMHASAKLISWLGVKGRGWAHMATTFHQHPSPAQPCPALPSAAPPALLPLPLRTRGVGDGHLLAQPLHQLEPVDDVAQQVHCCLRAGTGGAGAGCQGQCSSGTRVAWQAGVQRLGGGCGASRNGPPSS